MKPSVNQFTDDFKLQVIQEYLNSDCSQRDLMAKYNLSGGSIITVWMRKFGFKTPQSEPQTNRLYMPKKNDKSFKERELEAKIDELQKQLDYEQLRTLALNTLIDVAERDLKISIRKKPGTKQ